MVVYNLTYRLSDEAEDPVGKWMRTGTVVKLAVAVSTKRTAAIVTDL